MKRLILILFALVSLGFMALAKSDKAPEITFEHLTHDFGNIHRSKGPVSVEFTYTNTGTAPLTLTTVSAPCGCTSTDFSARPLAPGKSAKIKATFDPKSRSGEFTGSISVYTNIKTAKGKKKVILRISGTVIPD